MVYRGRGGRETPRYYNKPSLCLTWTKRFAYSTWMKSLPLPKLHVIEEWCAAFSWGCASNLLISPIPHNCLTLQVCLSEIHGNWIIGKDTSWMYNANRPEAITIHKEAQFLVKTTFSSISYRYQWSKNDSFSPSHYFLKRYAQLEVGGWKKQLSLESEVQSSCFISHHGKAIPDSQVSTRVFSTSCNDKHQSYEVGKELSC